VRIEFDSKDEAIAFARKHGFAFTVQEPHERKPQPKAYADNFAFDRRSNWTH
jgi:hypothetical protein